jgi:hypothetical protein
MLRTYAVMSQRARPRKAADRALGAASAAAREKWSALQHLAGQLRALPKGPPHGEEGVAPHDDAAATELEAALAAVGAPDPNAPSGSGQHYPSAGIVLFHHAQTQGRASKKGVLSGSTDSAGARFL